MWWMQLIPYWHELQIWTKCCWIEKFRPTYDSMLFIRHRRFCTALDWHSQLKLVCSSTVYKGDNYSVVSKVPNIATMRHFISPDLLIRVVDVILRYIYWTEINNDSTLLNPNLTSMWKDNHLFLELESKCQILKRSMGSRPIKNTLLTTSAQKKNIDAVHNMALYNRGITLYKIEETTGFISVKETILHEHLHMSNIHVRVHALNDIRWNEGYTGHLL